MRIYYRMGLSFELINVSINTLIIVKSLRSYGTVNCIAVLISNEGWEAVGNLGSGVLGAGGCLRSSCGFGRTLR
jgi:hypothetical protein